jgi:hypothetical protein
MMASKPDDIYSVGYTEGYNDGRSEIRSVMVANIVVTAKRIAREVKTRGVENMPTNLVDRYVNLVVMFNEIFSEQDQEMAKVFFEPENAPSTLASMDEWEAYLIQNRG